MIALITALLVFQGGTDPLPVRAYQPHLFDPGLDGGIFRWFSGNAEFSPDGRLILGFPSPSSRPSKLYRSALMAGLLRPERLIPDTHGHLDRFFQPIGNGTNPSGFGTDFALDWPLNCRPDRTASTASRATPSFTSGTHWRAVPRPGGIRIRVVASHRVGRRSRSDSRTASSWTPASRFLSSSGTRTSPSPWCRRSWATRTARRTSGPTRPAAPSRPTRSGSSAPTSPASTGTSIATR